MRALKSILILFLLIGVSTNVFSQKLNKLLLVTQYKYIQLPTDPLLKEYKTYTLKVSGTYKNYNKLIYSKFNLSGFEKKESGVSDFIIKIHDYPFKLDPQREHYTKKKKVDGVEKTIDYYYFSYDISHKQSAKMFDNTGKELFSTVLDLSSIGKTKHRTNLSQTAGDLSKKTEELKESNRSKGAIKLLNLYNDKFGYPKKTKTFKGFRIKAKKHNYDDFENAFDIAVEAAEIVKENENDTQTCFDAYKPAIDVWEKALEESNIDNKKARINKNVTCACYYNIGHAYLLCKDYDKAIEIFSKALEIDDKFSNIDDLIKFCENRKKRAEANQ